MIKLPQEFEIRMQDMLKEAYPAFLHSYEKENFRSLRVNELKGSTEQFLEYGLFSLKPVAWEKNGFYYSEEDQPGRHPMHEAGLYYIQEPSPVKRYWTFVQHPVEKLHRLLLIYRIRVSWYVMRFIRSGQRFFLKM